MPCGLGNSTAIDGRVIAALDFIESCCLLLIIAALDFIESCCLLLIIAALDFRILLVAANYSRVKANYMTSYARENINSTLTLPKSGQRYQ